MRADQRGMGRYVRAVLRDLAADAAVELTLLVRDVRNTAAYRELVPQAHIGPPRAARHPDAFAAVWYPWNGMPFECRAPAVVTMNDDFAFRFPAAGRIARWREQRPIQSAVRNAREIITISNWSRAQLTERFALTPERVTVVPLGPDPIFQCGDDISPFDQPFILAVGARERRKNIGFLIDVFARAFPARDVRLVVVGSIGVSQRRHASAAGVGLIEQGEVDDIELRRLYRTATAVAVPSFAEGFGLVAVEAQACGAPVIAADTSALPEAVGLAGILLDPADSDAWTAALQQLVRDRALNAYYRAQSAQRWSAASRPRTTDAVRAVLQRAIDHGA